MGKIICTILLLLSFNCYGSTTLYKLIYELESSSGTNLYQPGQTTCDRNKSACGHHQLTPEALNEIGYGHINYWILRSNYKWSKARALEYMSWLDKSYPSKSIVFKYLAYNIGGHGVTEAYKVMNGTRKTLTKEMRRNLISNIPSNKRKLWSTYSDQQLATQFIKLKTRVVNNRLRRIK